MVCQRSNQNEILRGNKNDQNVRVRMVAPYHKVQLRSKVDGWYGKLRGNSDLVYNVRVSKNLSKMR